MTRRPKDLPAAYRRARRCLRVAICEAEALSAWMLFGMNPNTCNSNGVTLEFRRTRAIRQVQKYQSKCRDLRKTMEREA